MKLCFVILFLCLIAFVCTKSRLHRTRPHQLWNNRKMSPVPSLLIQDYDIVLFSYIVDAEKIKNLSLSLANVPTNHTHEYIFAKLCTFKYSFEPPN